MDLRPTYKAAVREARKRLKTARIILAAGSVRADEAAGPLWNGWQQIARAAALVTSPSSDEPKAQLAHAAKAKGPLASIPKSALASLGWIAAAAAGNSATHTEDVPKERWLLAVDHLNEAIWAMTRWDRRNLASSGEKTARMISNVGLITLAPVLATVLILGIHIAAGVPDADDGLSATYYTQPGFEGHPLDRVDHQVDLAWTDKPPLKGLGRPGFSVRFEGCLVADDDLSRIIAVGADSPVKLWVDDVLAVARTRPDGYELSWMEKPLKPGIHKLKIEYPDCKLPGMLVLGWASTAKETPRPIPASNLVPLGGNGKHPCPADQRRAVSSR